MSPLSWAQHRFLVVAQAGNLSITPRAIQDLLDELGKSQSKAGCVLGMFCRDSVWFSPRLETLQSPRCLATKTVAKHLFRALAGDAIMICALMIAVSAAFSAGEPYKAMLPDEAKIGSIPLILKEGSRNMSSRFFYVQFKFTPKIRTSSVPTNKQHGAVVQVPKDLVQRMQSESINENLSEKANRPRSCAESRSRHIPDRSGAGRRAVPRRCNLV